VPQDKPAEALVLISSFLSDRQLPTENNWWLQNNLCCDRHNRSCSIGSLAYLRAELKLLSQKGHIVGTWL
jgi:hypothetical protein